MKVFYAIIYLAIAFILPVMMEKESYTKKVKMRFLLRQEVPQYLLWIFVAGLIFIGVIPGIFYIVYCLMMHNIAV